MKTIERVADNYAQRLNVAVKCSDLNFNHIREAIIFGARWQEKQKDNLMDKMEKTIMITNESLNKLGDLCIQQRDQIQQMYTKEEVKAAFTSWFQAYIVEKREITSFEQFWTNEMIKKEEIPFIE